MGGKYRVCFGKDKEYCVWIPHYRSSGWPFEMRPVPRPEPDPNPWDDVITIGGKPQPWVKDLSILAAIDSLVVNIDNHDLQESLQAGVSRAREVAKASLPEGLELRVEASGDERSEAY